MSLGHLFNTNGNHQDLEFQFLLHKGDETLTGIVVYQIPGDFNNDGAVNIGDYVVWRSGLGTTYMQSDYNVWRAHFGLTFMGSASGNSTSAAAVSAVPEPESLLVLLFAVVSVIGYSRVKI